MMVIVRRLVQMVLILGVLSFVLFGLLSAMPGDPVDMLITSNPRIKPEDVVRLKKLRGLDKPWYVQYVRWIWGYNDPRRPPQVSDTLPVLSALLEDGEVTLTVDVKDGLHDPDYRHTQQAFLDAVKAAEPGAVEKITKDPLPKDDKEALSELGERLFGAAPAAHTAVLKTLQLKAAESIEVNGLHGAKAEGHKVTQTFKTPGQHAIWFVAKDSDGLEAIGMVPVYVAVRPPPPPPPEPGDEDENRQVAGGTENPDEEPQEPEELQPRDIMKLAREVKNVFLAPIPSKVVDNPETFAVDLKEYLRNLDDAEKSKVRFSLAKGDPGTIDGEGVYRHTFDGPGQTAIRLTAKHADGAEFVGAFSVEHGPIADKERFNRGFLWVFAGDTEALGFSNTYKRPVWEILAGTQVECGDSLQGPGETCDDGNLEDGDGCSSVCHDESLGFFARADANMAGWLITSGRIVNTVQLMFPAILISLIIAIPLGVICAYKQYSWIDYLSNFFAFVGISLPVFWFAIMVLALVAEKLQLLPAGGIQTPGIEGGFATVLLDRLEHSLMPAFVLSIAYIGRWLRYMRGSMLEVLPLDFIRTARAKGLSEWIVILKHALRNALIPVVTVLALSVPALFGGALLTETVFAWPGIGRLQYDSVMNNDYYVAIVVFLISSGLLMLGNLLADVLYVIVDPRIRKS
jgi:cysteine-rich repeat protein